MAISRKSENARAGSRVCRRFADDTLGTPKSAWCGRTAGVIPPPTRSASLAISVLLARYIGSVLMKDQRLDCTRRIRHKFDLGADDRYEKTRMSIHYALIHYRNRRLACPLRCQPIPACAMVSEKVGARSYTPTNFASSPFAIGTALRSVANTTGLPSVTSRSC